MDYASLEIELHVWGSQQYAINFRLSDSRSDADAREHVVGLDLGCFDRQRFVPHLLDPQAYGKQLSECVFPGDRAKRAFDEARMKAQALNVPLRVQLLLHPEMPMLHDLRWELLRDPVDDTPLFTRDDMLFSRYLSSSDSRPVRIRRRDELKALLVVANPQNVGDYGFDPIDVDAEVTRANNALAGIDVTKIAERGASLAGIMDELRDSEADNGYDILYLVCHGKYVQPKKKAASGELPGDPKIWLEDDEGKAEVVSGAALVGHLMEIKARPNLIVLVSCQSAGTGDDACLTDEGAMAALGPRLSRSGIPAVVAMQGNVTMQTIDGFMPAFFETLRETGQIDLAMNRGRGAVRDRPDSWMPVLFMRLNSGRIWARPGSRRLGGRLGQFDAWEGLIGQIEDGECTPILGPGLLEGLIGSRRQLAQRWADLYRYPMAEFHRHDLPQIAQFLAVTQGGKTPVREMSKDLHRELIRRFGDELPELKDKRNFTVLLSHVARWMRENDENEPHRVLAELPFRIYLTTNADTVMEDALEEAEGPDGQKKQPKREIFDWRSPNPSLPGLFDEDSDYDPTPESPLVYHLFGWLPERKSLVLSQDDFFDYLMGSIRNKHSVPACIQESLAGSGLLFLGFELHDWDFRILWKSICSQPGTAFAYQRGFKHVGIQIDPEDERFPDPDRARRYLEKLGLYETPQVDIYWGTADSFVKELRRRWSAAYR